MKKEMLTALMSCLLFWSFGAGAKESDRSFAGGRFDASLKAKYFTTKSNFDSSGGKQALTGDSSLQSLKMVTEARYVPVNGFGIYSGLNFNNVETNNGVLKRSNSILTSYYLGTDFRFYGSKKWTIFADLSFQGANERFDATTNEAIASDGTDHLDGSVVAALESGSFKSFARGGFTSRGEGLSSLFTYGAGAELRFSDSGVGLEIDGYATVKDDELTSQPSVRDNLTTRVNAGSKEYYAINPNSLEAQLYYSYNFNHEFKLKVAGGGRVVGSNTADGYFGEVGLLWGFGGGMAKAATSIPDDDPGFKIDVDDGVNQQLFKKANPVPVQEKK